MYVLACIRYRVYEFIKSQYRQESMPATVISKWGISASQPSFNRIITQHVHHPSSPEFP